MRGKRVVRNREENRAYELENFKFFKEHQLDKVNFETGEISTKHKSVLKNGTVYYRRRFDVGSKNEDGYIRVWCDDRLRMKHRLLWWLKHGELPDEIDHINGIRDDNRICNLRSVNRKEQLTNIKSNPNRTARVFSVRDLHTICHLISLGTSDSVIAKLLKCSRAAVMNIRNKKNHRDVSDQYF